MTPRGSQGEALTSNRSTPLGAITDQCPEFVGKTESAYAQCYDKVRIFFALRGKLN